MVTGIEPRKKDTLNRITLNIECSFTFEQKRETDVYVWLKGVLDALLTGCKWFVNPRM